MPDAKRFLDRLHDFPFVNRADLLVRSAARGPYPTAPALRLRTPRGDFDFLVELKRTHLSYAIVEGVVARAAKAGGPPWILFARYVGRPMGRHLAAHGINYIDAVGNCHLRLGDAYLTTIEGKTPGRESAQTRGIGAPGYQVLFAILAQPELLDVPIRRLAEAAGVGKTTAAEVLSRLRAEGFVVPGQKRRHLRNADALLDRWLAGYATLVRPRLLFGRYRTADADPAALETRVERSLGAQFQWAWGSGAAAMRLVPHYRGSDTVLHIQNPPADFPRRFQALLADDGPLTILRAPGAIAFQGAAPRTVHPLLVFTELLVAGTERAREAAQAIRERYLGSWT